MGNMLRYEIIIDGIVQGVGFRPFIHNLAESLSLSGWVNNNGSSVVIEADGEKEILDTFVQKIKSEAPVLSHIKNIEIKVREPAGYKGFEIRKSKKSEDVNVYISPDVSTCADCERELFDSTDRRYLYPFINCTNCGPRFSIIKDIPYDRINTTMSFFVMCDQCKSEYTNPSNRRYHAQPVSCYDCGPELMLLDNHGDTVHPDVPEDPIHHTQNLLLSGRIVAVKGLGGFHLACNALDAESVKRLRRRKLRDEKPFAIMARNYDTALKYAFITETEKELLMSEKKPIVLLRKREGSGLPDEIAPGNPYVGIMLPYTPVHMLLFHNDEASNTQAPEVLVMTSGNRSNEPICFKDDEAAQNLGDIADYFLTNNREIHIRTDDSVVRIFRNKEFLVRRSRGYVPCPVTCDAAISSISLAKVPSVLACGGELKNTFCLNRENEFYLSHHIGDLENNETLMSFEQGIEHFKRLLNINCDIIAYDMHPEYLSTKYAAALDGNIEKIAVQHHHAHIASCMAENDLTGDVIGVAFDGTGYGEDGHIWGGEFFTGSYEGFKREGHLDYVKMPGGEMAIKEPWRMAASYVYQLKRVLPKMKGIESQLIETKSHIKVKQDQESHTVPDGSVFNGIEGYKLSAVIQMLDKNINSPLTSSMGRLFDAAASLSGIRNVIYYEGQAAIEFEHIAEKSYCGEYDFGILEEQDGFKVDVIKIIEAILSDRHRGIPAGIISGKFHETAANIVLRACINIREKTSLDRVVLSGGVFQNMTLLEKSLTKLESAGFKVFIHSRVPSNDGGISLGQAAIAIAKSNQNRLITL